MASYAIRDFAVLGMPARQLEVEGPWEPGWSALFGRERCNAVLWRPPRATSTCEPLLELVPALEHLRVVASKSMDDAALGEMTSLRSLEALTKGKRPLDLSALTHLRALFIDDRPGLTGFCGESLESAGFYNNQRRLGEFEQACRLTDLMLEGRRGQSVELRATLPMLTRLRVVDHVVESVGGLRTPLLELLHLDASQGPDELDLKPLAQMHQLKWLHVRGPRHLRNVIALAGIAGLKFTWSAHIDEEDLDRLPPEWVRAHNL
jgi:hypothetical protein